MFKSEDKTKQSQNVETIIGPSVKVEGDFAGNGDMIIEGIVLGNLKTKNFLRVGKDAKIKADVEALNAYVAGEITGNLTIKESLELTATAKITGDVETKQLAVEKGAYLNGRVTMDLQAADQQPKPSVKMSEKNN
ncbi:polymer-forming cytoskeletal protein [Patescibacteria group bacterium]|nr:polymer-forming cytoskeletal protein [Patescibacteria group bacterium]